MQGQLLRQRATQFGVVVGDQDFTGLGHHHPCRWGEREHSHPARAECILPRAVGQNDLGCVKMGVI